MVPADRNISILLLYSQVLHTENRVGQCIFANVIVGGNTICTTNLSASGAVQENDVITMTCSITYSGNWAPVMRWFNSVTSRSFTDDVITLTTNETMVTSQLTVTSSAGLHDSKIVCLTNFTQPSPPLSTSATNVPSYTYTWTSPILNVTCKPNASDFLLLKGM